MKPNRLSPWALILTFLGVEYATSAEILVSPEATRTFPSKVQPILMNLCARCHCRQDHPSGFRLDRVTEGYSNEKATIRNIRLAVTYVDSRQVEASPLLLKAVTPHGGLNDPPLHGPNHPAFRHLEEWVRLASSTMTKPSNSDSAQQFQSDTISNHRLTDSTQAPLPQIAHQEARQHTPMKTMGTTHHDDPFDPRLFNRSR